MSDCSLRYCDGVKEEREKGSRASIKKFACYVDVPVTRILEYSKAVDIGVKHVVCALYISTL